LIDEKILSALIPGEVNLRLVEPHIYSVYSPGEHTGSYDRVASFYDLVMGNRYYNRLMWGYRVEDFASFCHHSLASSTDGWILDAGCGSLVFTAKTYAGYSERPVVLLDESIQMLRAAKSRLIRLTGGVPQNMVFLHGDVLQLPFKPAGFRTVLSMNILHVLRDVERVLLELGNVMEEGGTMSLTSLIASNRFGDMYLKMLGRIGQVVPRTPDQLMAIFNQLELPAKYSVRGNMMFISNC